MLTGGVVHDGAELRLHVDPAGARRAAELIAFRDTVRGRADEAKRPAAAPDGEANRACARARATSVRSMCRIRHGPADAPEPLARGGASG